MKIAVAMPDETYAAYKRLAGEQSRAMAAIMRDALHEYLERQPEAAPSA